MALEIRYYEELTSTHTFLMERFNDGSITPPLLIYTHHQTDGIGSRNNEWTGIRGNLFFSFVITKAHLPLDIPLASISIYFGYILKSILQEQGSQVFLKWPNDFYLGDQKIGGIITTKKKEHFFVGVGLNLIKDETFHSLDIALDIDLFFEKLAQNIKKPLLWNRVFKLYKVEFKLSKNLITHSNNEEISLKNAILNDDGSLNLNGRKIYSLR